MPRMVIKWASSALIASVLVFTACVDGQEQAGALSGEALHARQLDVYAAAAADPKQFRADLKENCQHFGTALLMAAETIQLGTRMFNAGAAGLTKRIYEGTIYKLLYTVKDDCMELSDVLQIGLEKAYAGEDHHDQAWVMRNVLDLIMGGPPLRPPGA